MPGTDTYSGMLLPVLYSARSERHLVAQINHNLLFFWFVGLAIDDTVWNDRGSSGVSRSCGREIRRSRIGKF